MAVENDPERDFLWLMLVIMIDNGKRVAIHSLDANQSWLAIG